MYFSSVVDLPELAVVLTDKPLCSFILFDMSAIKKQTKQKQKPNPNHHHHHYQKHRKTTKEEKHYSNLQNLLSFRYIYYRTYLDLSNEKTSALWSNTMIVFPLLIASMLKYASTSFRNMI